jgi:hypothetical protein
MVYDTWIALVPKPNGSLSMASFSALIVLVKLVAVLVAVLVPVRPVPRPNLAEPPDQSM